MLMPVRKLPSLLSALVLLMLGWTNSATAEGQRVAYSNPFGRALANTDGVEPHIGDTAQRATVRRGRFYFYPEYTTLKNGGTSLSGVGFGTGINYGMSRKLGIGGGFRQSFSTSTFTAFLSQLELQLIWAVTGGLILNEDITMLGGKQVVTAKNQSQGGLRIRAHVVQYYFNSASASIPLSGLGGSLGYEFSSSGSLNWEAGFRMDAITSATTSMTPMQVYIGTNVWF